MTSPNHAPFPVAAILALSVCTAASALAQTADQPSPSDFQSTEAQDQFQRDKDTLADESQRAVDAADANIDALRKMAKSEHADVKKRREEIVSKLSILRDHVHANIHKMDKATLNDWNELRPVMDRDLAALNDELRTAAPITHVPLPADETP